MKELAEVYRYKCGFNDGFQRLAPSEASSKYVDGYLAGQIAYYSNNR